MSKVKTEPNKKFAILVHMLPPNCENDAVRYFPEQHIVKVIPYEWGLKIYFDDYEHAKESIQRRTVLVRGVSYNIYGLVTDLTVHGIRNCASKRTISDIMRSYGPVLDLYPIKRIEKINGYDKIFLSDDYRINLDLPEVYAICDLSPIRLPNQDRAFEVSFYCRHCSSDGHTPSQCRQSETCLINTSLPRKSSKYYKRLPREIYTPIPSMKQAEEKLHQNSPNSYRRRSDENNTTTLHMNKTTKKQAQNNHDIKNTHGVSLHANTSNLLLNPRDQEQSLNHLITESCDTVYETDTSNTAINLSRKVQYQYSPDMSNISLKADASDSLVYQNEGVDYNQIYSCEKIFYESRACDSPKNKIEKGEHQCSLDIINGLESEYLLMNQNTLEKNSNGCSVYKNRRMSNDCYFPYSPVNLKTEKESQINHDIFNGIRRNALETDRSNRFANNEKQYHNNCTTYRYDRISYRRNSHSPVFESDICRKEQRRKSLENFVPNSIRQQTQKSNKNNVSFQQEHQEFKNCSAIKIEHCAAEDLQPAQKIIKSEFKDENSAKSRSMFSYPGETANRFKDSTFGKSHGEKTGDFPPTTSKTNSRVSSRSSKTAMKKPKISLRSILAKILPPHIDVETMHEHLKKSVNGPTNVMDAATELEKILDWKGVLKRKLTKEERTVAKWIGKSLNEYKNMKDKRNFNKCSQIDSSRQRDATGEQSSSESARNISRRQRIKTLTPAIQEAISKTPGVLKAEELCNFLNHIRGRKKLEIVSNFTSDIPGLVAQLREVKKNYYLHIWKRGAAEDADINFMTRLAERLDKISIAPEYCVQQESGYFMTQSNNVDAMMNRSPSCDDPSVGYIQRGGSDAFSTVTVKEEIEDIE